MHRLVSATARALIIGMWGYSALAAPPASLPKKVAPAKFKSAKKEPVKAPSNVRPVPAEPLAVGNVRAPKLERHRGDLRRPQVRVVPALDR